MVRRSWWWCVVVAFRGGPSTWGHWDVLVGPRQSVESVKEQTKSKKGHTFQTRQGRNREPRGDATSARIGACHAEGVALPIAHAMLPASCVALPVAHSMYRTMCCPRRGSCRVSPAQGVVLPVARAMGRAVCRAVCRLHKELRCPLPTPGVAHVMHRSMCVTRTICHATHHLWYTCT